jgi:hypothetical protein
MPPEITGRLLVCGSFVVIGIGGYFSHVVLTSRKLARWTKSLLIVILLGFMFSATLLLTDIAALKFQRAEVFAYKNSGRITEEQMQPDMPNLMTGLLFLGLPSFLLGIQIGIQHRKHIRVPI